MDMVYTHNSTNGLNLKSLLYLTYKITNSQGKVTSKNLVTVFRHPYEMVLDLIRAVAATLLV